LKLEDFAGLSISEAAELIRHEPAEHGLIYTPAGRAVFYAASRHGTPHRVTVPLWKAGLLRGNIFVHNHPGSESFSAEDIWILIRHGAREVHVYGPERSFRIVTTDRTRRFSYRSESVGWSELSREYERAVVETDSRFEEFVRARLFTRPRAWAAQTHGVVRRMSVRFCFAYLEIRI
jgi:hypothetical protein